MRKFLLSSAICLCICGPVAAAGPEEGLFNAAKTMIANAQTLPEQEKIAAYKSAKGLLDLVGGSYPTTDIGQAILAEDVVGGIDIGALNEAIANNSFEGVDPVLLDIGDTIVTNRPSEKPVQVEPVAPPSDEAPAGSVAALVPEVEPEIPEKTDETIAVLEPMEDQASLAEVSPARSEKEIVKDVQTELNRIGCNAGSADGVAGRKTKAAFEDFLIFANSDLDSEMLATEEAAAELHNATDPICTSRWLAVNAPAKLQGSWSFRADCQLLFKKVRINGEMRLEMTAPGRYQGPVSNSLGERGTIYAVVSGNAVSTQINWPRQTTTARLFTSTRSASLSGKDSNNCAVVAWKN